MTFPLPFEGFRFCHYHQGRADQPHARLWLHQFKLLEGIDDDQFTQVWLYDSFGNARSLIQQIGRAVRYSEKRPTALIRASRNEVRTTLGKMTARELLQTRWSEYEKFEKYAETSPDRAFKAETQLLALLKKTAPSSQYIGGEFRGAFFERDNLGLDDFIVPRRGTICSLKDSPSSEKNKAELMDALQEMIREAMYLEERFDIKVALIPERAPLDHRSCRLIHYLAWNNSPYVRTLGLPEWRLGVFLMVLVDTHIVMVDSEGLCLDLDRLRMGSPTQFELERLFAKGDENSKTKRTRIVEASSVGLDLGEIGIRSMSVRRHNLGESYFDLSESSQIPSVISGIAPHGTSTNRRRLSLRNSRISDPISRNIPVSEYFTWAREVVRTLTNENVEPHGFFKRFAREVPPPDKESGQAESLFLDLWDVLMVDDETLKERKWDVAKIDEVLALDTCLEVHRVPDAADRTKYLAHFADCAIEIEYVLTNSTPPTARYKLTSIELDDLVAQPDSAAGTAQDNDSKQDLAESLISVLNREQSFRVIPAIPDRMIVYAQKHFFDPSLDLTSMGTSATGTLLDVIEPVTEMNNVVSEKGETRVLRPEGWATRTLFGFVDAAFRGTNKATVPIVSDLQKCDLLICDDGGTEICDFFAVDEANNRVFMIHAKDKSIRKSSPFVRPNDGCIGYSAARLQEVCRQAQASLAFVGVAGAPFDLPSSWANKLKIKMKGNGKSVLKELSYGRISLRRGTCSPDMAHRRLKRVFSNPKCTREVVVLTSGILGRESIRTALASGEPDNLARQFVYYLASIQSAFTRAGVRLRLISNP